MSSESRVAGYWGHVRPGTGARTVQLQRRVGGSFQNEGTPITTDSGGYFNVSKSARASYRYEAFKVAGDPSSSLGFSRVATPVPSAR